MRISDWSSDVCSSDLSPVRSKDVHPAVINSPQWSVKGLFAIVSYTGPMPQTREIIFEFHRVGGYVKVSAVDTLTSAEVSIVGPPSAGQIGRAHVRTPVTNANLVCRLLLEK